jgi:cytochrome d ubiquinol oxidase subunit I
MFNPAWVSQTMHMTLAAFEATAFAVAGIHAFLLLRHKGEKIHQKALIIALSLGSVAAILQPFSGDFSAKDVARRQPIKLAAMEGLFETERGAGLTIGGIPDENAGITRYGLKIPLALSYLAYGDFHSEVKGLNEFPRENRPPVLGTHLAFQLMVGCGSVLALTGVLFWLFRIKNRSIITGKHFLGLIALCTPLGFIAVESGWFVTELGRQPWIIYGIMKTSESVTPVPGQIFHFLFFLTIYILLSGIGVWLMSRQIRVLHEDIHSEGRV